MSKNIGWVDGWEIQLRDDGGYGVYDEHGLVAGPFGTEQAAFNAALHLPKRGGKRALPGQHNGT
jgi:hypothetical protein